MKILFAGDFHQSYMAAQNAVVAAHRDKVNTIIQLGDFGLWGDKSGAYFLGYLNKRLHKHGIHLVFVPGNHEDYDEIARLEEFGERNEDGHIKVRSNIYMVPRGCVWEWDGKRFLGLGGAFSVDRSMGKEGERWFADEVITYADVDRAVENVDGRDVDVFVTHDCSNKTPWKTRIKPDPDSMENRRKIDEVLERVKPDMHFHGHMHTWYDWTLTYGSVFEAGSSDKTTQVYGLDMECERNSTGILDTSTMEFKQIPWKMPRRSLYNAPDLVV
jgi:Icc-related predicted phosphoesterase